MTGPDGADRVVWAIGGLFFLFLSCLFIFYLPFNVYSTKYMTEKAGDDENGPR